MEGHITEREAALPIDEYSRKKSPGRRAADRYVKLGQAEAQKTKGKTLAVEPLTKPETARKTKDSTSPDPQIKSIVETIRMAKSDWIHFGLIQAQAKSKTRWQTYAFVLTVLFVGVLLADIWLYMDRAMYARQNEQNIQELSAARMELTTASTAAVKADRLQAENDKLAVDNATFKAQNLLLSDKLELFSKSVNDDISQAALMAKAPGIEITNQQQRLIFNDDKTDKPVMPKIQKIQPLVSDITQNTKSPAESLYTKAEPKPVADRFAESQEKVQEKPKQEKQKRIGTIRKGLYPKNMTKDELIASLGEPDRIYKGQVYEQLVYFNHTPRRFWFKNGPYFERAE